MRSCLNPAAGFIFGLGPNASIEKLLVRWPEEYKNQFQVSNRASVSSLPRSCRRKIMESAGQRKSLTPLAPVFPDPEPSARIVLSARLSPLRSIFNPKTVCPNSRLIV